MKVLRTLPFRLAAVLLTACLLVPFAPTLAVAKSTVPHLKAWVSNKTPAQYTNVTVYAKATDKSGKPVAGVKVTFTWKFKTTSHKVTARTNKSGVASSTRWISGASKGHRVTITVKATVKGKALSATTYFVPR